MLLHRYAGPVSAPTQVGCLQTVFQGKYELMQNLAPKGDGAWQLYYIESDPSELNTFFAAEMPELVVALKELNTDYSERIGLVPVSEGYNPQAQTLINTNRGGSH
jgi:arylsulfatase